MLAVFSEKQQAGLSENTFQNYQIDEIEKIRRAMFFSLEILIGIYFSITKKI